MNDSTNDQATEFEPAPEQDEAVAPEYLDVGISLTLPGAMEPSYATDGSGCFDIYSPVGGGMGPLDSSLVDTGVAFEIPADHTMLVFGRSGHGINNEVRLSNCVGVIDSDFRGSIKVKLKSDNRYGNFSFNKGDRIAQALIIKTPRARFYVVEQLSKTERGDGGLGSTGA